MQNAGQPLFTDTAQQCLRHSEEQSAWSSNPLVLHWLFGTANKEENVAKTPDSWWVH